MGHDECRTTGQEVSYIQEEREGTKILHTSFILTPQTSGGLTLAQVLCRGVIYGVGVRCYYWTVTEKSAALIG